MGAVRVPPSGSYRLFRNWTRSAFCPELKPSLMQAVVVVHNCQQPRESSVGAEAALQLGRTLDFFKVPEREKGEVLAAFAAHKGEVTEGYSQ